MRDSQAQGKSLPLDFSTEHLFHSLFPGRAFPLRRWKLLGRLQAQPPVGQFVDALQLLIDDLRQSKRIERLQQTLQRGQLGGIGLRRSQHALEGGLRGTIDPSQFRSHADPLHQLHRRQVEVQPQAQLVAVEIVHSLHRCGGIVAVPAQELAHMRPIFLLHVRIVVFLIRTPSSELDLFPLTPGPQVPVDEFRTVIRVQAESKWPGLVRL